MGVGRKSQETLRSSKRPHSRADSRREGPGDKPHPDPRCQDLTCSDRAASAIAGPLHPAVATRGIRAEIHAGWISRLP